VSGWRNGKYANLGEIYNLEPVKQFSDARYISLETYRKSGVGVKTTVWLVEHNGLLYVRTSPKSGKAKRIRRNTHVRVAKSDMRGKVKGGWVEGEAKQVDEKESDRIRGLFMKKYGTQIKLLGGLSWLMRSRRDDSFVISIQLANH